MNVSFKLFFWSLIPLFIFTQNKSIDHPELYLPYLVKKKIGLVVNQNSKIDNIHLIDSLIKLGINVKSIFAPEHGFKINYGAGEKIKNESFKNIPIYSLYGDKKKPSSTLLENLDLILFDIQDVGVRFYTYISTLHYVMEACAETKTPLIVLDRDNLNSNYVDGPVLDLNYSSFVGMHQVPVLYGMTIGEYALMINGENWLSDSLKCDLKVIPFPKKNNYYITNSQLNVSPSPNLKTNFSIFLYPTLCFFEGTVISIGRGTDYPFQVLGAPELDGIMLSHDFSEYFYSNEFSFTPKSRMESKNPKFKNKECFGLKFFLNNDSISIKYNQIDLDLIINTYLAYPKENVFFNSFFNKLAGNSTLMKKIKLGWDSERIRNSWATELNDFLKIREKYLLYKRK